MSRPNSHDDAYVAIRPMRIAGPAPDAGVMLGERPMDIEVLRPRQRRGLGHAGAEAVPGDHPGQRLEGILLAVMGGDQRGSDPGVKPDLLVDRPGIAA